MENNKIVYVAMTADLFHYGHINILNEAKKYGKVIVGILTDEAVESYKRKPIIKYKFRVKLVENIIDIYKVVKQDTLDYTSNLLKYKPNYVVHGDDWKKGIQSKVRENVINTLKKWNGQLIEPKYTDNISTTDLIEEIVKRHSK